MRRAATGGYIPVANGTRNTASLIPPGCGCAPPCRTPAKAPLQNTVTATDQQIDALVDELYGLNPVG